jgi:hypothetical protein
MSDELYAKLNALRDEYRRRMNAAASSAQEAAATDEMDKVSEFSTDSERMREAFHALNRAIAIVQAEWPI